MPEEVMLTDFDINIEFRDLDIVTFDCEGGCYGCLVAAEVPKNTANFDNLADFHDITNHPHDVCLCRCPEAYHKKIKVRKMGELIDEQERGNG